MLVEKTKYEAQGSLGGEKIAMGVDNANMAHILGILTKMYADNLLAILREYSTNALDAQIEAGVTRPIEVTLPTSFTPFLTVRDFGVGLSVEDIHLVYSQYGSSTKRSSNDFNGQLGIGCKSALAYTSQFTVTSVKAGTKVVVAISREEDGAGSMSVLDTLRVSEENGTVVSIPVARNDHAALRERTVKFYSVWNPATVLVDGAPPESYERFEVSPTLHIVETYARRGSTVVMGNVEYPCPALDGLCPRGSLVAYVPIGTVGFAPSREALDDTRRTKDAIEGIKVAFKAAATGAVQREVSKAATPAEAVAAVVKWSRYVPRSSQAGSYDYKGAVLPASYSRLVTRSKLTFDYALRKDVMKDYQASLLRWSRSTSSPLSRHERADAHDVSMWPGTIWVKGFTPETFNANHKNKLLKASGAIPNVEGFLLIEDYPELGQFVPADRVLDWEAVRKIQLQPRPQAGTGGNIRIPGSYDLYTEAYTTPYNGRKQYTRQAGVPGDQIRQDQPVFYVHGNHSAGSSAAASLGLYYGKFTLVCLGANRIEKFVRVLPKTMEWLKGIKAKFDAWAKALSADQKTALTQRANSAHSVLASLDAGQIDDPALTEAIRVAKIDSSTVWDQYNAFRRLVDVDSVLRPRADPLKKYLLFDSAFIRTDASHLYRYMNAAHAA